MNHSSVTNAIIVCGHAVYLGGRNLTPTASTHPSHWALLPFQKEETEQFIAQVRCGVQLAAADPNSVLIFSGGQTRNPHLLSEAQGYHNIALVHNFWGHESVVDRVTTEEFARDSHDNVIFGIARFNEFVKRYPTHLTFVSWPFKQQRFKFHIETIKWPVSRFTFVGVGEPSDGDNAVRSEGSTLDDFRKDPLGLGPILGVKKHSRNPYRRQHGYVTSCPGMTDLINWRSLGEILSPAVPWTELNKAESS